MDVGNRDMEHDDHDDDVVDDGEGKLLRDRRFEVTLTDKFNVINVTKDGAAGKPSSCQKKKNVHLCIECPYTREIVITAFRKRKRRWRIVDSSGKADLQWGDYENLDWTKIVSGELRANSYCIRKGLSRKAQLSLYVRKYLSKAHMRLTTGGKKMKLGGGGGCGGGGGGNWTKIEVEKEGMQAEKGTGLGSQQQPLPPPPPPLLPSCRNGVSNGVGATDALEVEVVKNTLYLLRAAMPNTIIIDTWEAFDDNMTFNLGGDIASFGDDMGVVQSVSACVRLDWCLQHIKEAMEHSKGPWILKPSTLNKGAEVAVIGTFEKLREIIHQYTDIREWVLQAYITSPLLYRGRKFHLRAYVLAVGCIRVLFFNKVLLLCAARPYDEEDFDDPYVHLTNTARQAEGHGFNEEECVKCLDDLVLELMRQSNGKVKLSTEEATLKVSGILEDMHIITAELFQAFRGEFAVFSPLPHCFELFGLDFMVDESFRVFLLEVNPGPDLRQTGESLKWLIVALVEQTITICCDGDGDGGGGDDGDAHNSGYVAAVGCGSSGGSGGGGDGSESLNGTYFTEVYAAEWMGGSDHKPTMKMI